MARHEEKFDMIILFPDKINKEIRKTFLFKLRNNITDNFSLRYIKIEKEHTRFYLKQFKPIFFIIIIPF